MICRRGKSAIDLSCWGKRMKSMELSRSIRMAATPSQSRSDRLYFSGRVQVVGKLVFVSLSNAGQSLREFLGTHYDYIRDLFGGQWALSCCSTDSKSELEGSRRKHSRELPPRRSP